jgi:hypothetical protein
MEPTSSSTNCDRFNVSHFKEFGNFFIGSSTIGTTSLVSCTAPLASYGTYGNCGVIHVISGFKQDQKGSYKSCIHRLVQSNCKIQRNER